MVTFTYGGHGIFPSGIMLELKVIRLPEAAAGALWGQAAAGCGLWCCVVVVVYIRGGRTADFKGPWALCVVNNVCVKAILAHNLGSTNIETKGSIK